MNSILSKYTCLQSYNVTKVLYNFTNLPQYFYQSFGLMKFLKIKLCLLIIHISFKRFSVVLVTYSQFVNKSMACACDKQKTSIDLFKHFFSFRHKCLNGKLDDLYSKMSYICYFLPEKSFSSNDRLLKCKPDTNCKWPHFKQINFNV